MPKRTSFSAGRIDRPGCIRSESCKLRIKNSKVTAKNAKSAKNSLAFIGAFAV